MHLLQKQSNGCRFVYDNLCFAVYYGACRVYNAFDFKNTAFANFKHFKKLIKELVRETKALAPEYTLFLSKFSSFMKMNSFNNYLRCNNNVFMLEEEIMLRKNREYSDKIEQMCRNWGSILILKLNTAKKSKQVF